MAEMVAGLYDASLDDIVPGANWMNTIESEITYPQYFQWYNNSFITEQFTNAYLQSGLNTILSTILIVYEYEELNLFGYDYFGDYNNAYHAYLEKVDEHKKNAKVDKLLETHFKINATEVKHGFLVTGRVVEDSTENGLAQVSISIKNTNITTASNSLGYFKIKVPANGMLIFRSKGYASQSFRIAKAANLIVHLKYKQLSLLLPPSPADKQLMAADPGPKWQKGDPNVQVRIDEPVGSADIMRVRESDAYAVKADTSRYNANAYKQRPLSAYDPLPHVAVPRPITIRKNFNETAFFYPQLHTNEKGEILIDFTIPEALTRWKFKAFAHTKDLKSGYLESEVVTQKKLSIAANMPRFFREGDTITISARLANLTATALKGEARLQLFNGLNMQPVKLLANGKDSLQNFEVAASSNKAIAFKMIIPAGLDAITYRLTAASGNYADGEENTYPVLPNRMLVTESMPMMVRAGQTKAFNFEKLINQKSSTLQNKSLTLEYTQNPAWYAVRALPYLMEFPYECSEQIFSRYYANSMASSLVNRMPEIKQVFDRWKATDSKALLSNLEKNQELKQTLIEETPWLRDAENESEQKNRIALLFDLNKMGNELSLNLDKLLKKQLPDGGFPWFGGDRSDRYITQHIAAGIGELYTLKAVDVNDPNIAAIKRNTLKYIGNQLIADDNEVRKIDKNYRTRDIGSTEIHAWYVNSYFINEKLSPELQTIHDDYLKRAEEYWTSKNVYEQAMIALTMLRNNKAQAANMIIRSLKETAQQTDDLGMYWAKNMLGYYWYQSPIETQCLLIELFTEAGNNDKAVEEMKIWLLRNKQTTNWKTTKATAAACYALLLKGDNWLATTANTSTIKLNGAELTTLKSDTKAEVGTGYIKTTWADEQVKPALGKVEINNTGKTISWGAVHWQYLEQLDKITPSQTDIHLERKYFIQKQTDAGAVLTAVDASHQPKTGDLLKVVVYLKAGRDFEYVQLKDMRPAGTEPVDALSTYKYQDGLYYYQVTKDVATNFFISNLGKGNYVFEYRLRVAQPGNFATGITTVQSMYAPEFNAHSEGARLTVKP